MLIILIIILILLILQISFSKYKSQKQYNQEMKIAEPIFIVEGKETTKISAINNIGYYEFSVKNYRNEEISETGFLYSIEVISQTDDSVKFELYNEENQIELDNLKTKQIQIVGNEKTEQKYKLKVTYDNTLGTKGKDILEEVQIKVHSEQEKIG